MNLKSRIVELIGMQGPLSVAEYMALCLSDPKDGYYMTRDPFGRAGDFITAPEISQMFGELVGAWLAATWQELGRPAPLVIAEIGPGRGTLMKDVFRTLSRIAPILCETASFHLVETSPKLTLTQKETLAGAGGRFHWHMDIGELPVGSLLIIGNELFDAIPLRQFVKTSNGWRERMVAVDDGDELRFAAGVAGLDPSFLPVAAAQAPEGAILEIAPARSALMQRIAERIASQGGAGLFFDYGYFVPDVGDTFQAMSGHAYADPLAEPGAADLTSHVNFHALAEVARAAGLQARLATQADFLLDLGLIERAGSLGHGKDEAVHQRLRGEVERLAGSDGMGQLFKAMAVAPPVTELAGFR